MPLHARARAAYAKQSRLSNVQRAAHTLRTASSSRNIPVTSKTSSQQSEGLGRVRRAHGSVWLRRRPLAKLRV
eukprot:6178226-Pleurochrysis_carterae.AAC.3